MDEDGRRSGEPPDTGPGASRQPPDERPIFIGGEPCTPQEAATLRALTADVLDALEVPAAMEVTVTCVDEDAIAALHAEHLGSEGPTDVLAFPVDAPGEVRPGEPALLGDVVLCPSVAAAQASARAASRDEELEVLTVHGLLHLLGYDHAEPDERAAMFALTDELLARFRRGDQAERPA